MMRWVCQSARHCRAVHSAAIAFGMALILASCELTPLGGSFSHATWEVGNSYTIEWPRQVYACAPSLTDNCIRREGGNFTVDGALFTVEGHVVFVHLVFEDGKSGWMRYNDFVGQQFANPVKTRLVFRYGMTPEQIKSTWGPPNDTSAETCPGHECENWVYTGIAKMSFTDGKVNDLKLTKSLPALN